MYDKICIDFCVLLHADLTASMDSFVRALPGLYVSVCSPMYCYLGEVVGGHWPLPPDYFL